MRKHHYRITVQKLTEAEGSPSDGEALVFAARCHDDIISIVERSRQRGLLDTDDAAAMAVGLKLLGEIALENRNDPLFSELAQDLGKFIKKLKSGN